MGLCMQGRSAQSSQAYLSHRREVVDKLVACFDEALRHEGYADITVSLRYRRKNEKEIIVHFGKEWRYVVRIPQESTPSHQAVEGGHMDE